MNLRIVPAVQSSPTVIFSLNWHNLPATLPLPNFYSGQFAACQDASIPSPRNLLALDKAVGFHLLLESVTFDLARGAVSVAWLDKRVQEWAIEDVQGLKAALEDVLDCVRQSGEEADKEKKASAAAAAQAKAGHSSSASVTSTSDTASTASSSSAHKRHRTASGIFSSLVASFITPPSSPDPNAPAQLYRARRSKTVSGVVPLIHKQNIFHPANKRESFPANTIPQSRFLRRQARAKLVDVFRYYVASRLTNEMRSSGIVGDELKERGILDDLDADEEDGASTPGTSGYAAAGGYVAYMARSMLHNALAEAKVEDDSFSSSSEDSLLLTPPNNSDASLPSDTSATKSRPTSPRPTPGSPRRRAPTPSPQARQIRHLSSLLIGLTQKDKRTASEDREMLDMIKDRSLRRRYSLCEASPSRAGSPLRSSSVPADWTKPIVSSPLRTVEIAEPEEEDSEIIVIRRTASPEPTVPFPSDAAAPVPFPTDAISAPSVPRRCQSLPAPPPSSFEEIADESMEQDITASSTSTKAAEAEDLLATSRQRRSAILASPSSSAPASPAGQTISLPARPPLAPIQTASSTSAEESDLIAIRDLPSLPSPKYTEVDEKRFGMMQKQQQQSFPEDVDEDEDEDSMRVSPPPSYAPTLDAPVQSFREVDVKATAGGVIDQVRGLELDTQTAYWPHVSDGIYVV